METWAWKLVLGVVLVVVLVVPIAGLVVRAALKAPTAVVGYYCEC